MLDAKLSARVANRSGDRCAVCEFSLGPALAIHHRIPVEFGGTDSPSNLVLVCGNCHRLIHYFGADTRRLKDARTHLDAEYSGAAVARLAHLARSVYSARQRVIKNENIVPGSPAFDKALEQVGVRNALSENRTRMLARAARLVSRKIPRIARPLVAYRIPHRAKYFAINCTNYLLFRSPSYSDGGVRQHWDVYLILPRGTGKLSFRAIRDRDIVHQFERFDCDNVGLSFEDLLKFNASDWREFRTACTKAATAPASRAWSSNVAPPSKSS